MITIREALSEEASQLAEFGRRLFWEAYQGYTADEKLEAFMDQRYTAENFLRMISDPSTPTFLAEDEVWKGYASLDLTSQPHPSLPQESSPVYVSLLYVDQRFQGQGIGAMLLDRLFEVTKERGFDYVWLSVWKITPAPAFYRKMGFAEIGEIPFTYPDGSYDVDWVMGKPL